MLHSGQSRSTLFLSIFCISACTVASCSSEDGDPQYPLADGSVDGADSSTTDSGDSGVAGKSGTGGSGGVAGSGGAGGSAGTAGSGGKAGSGGSAGGSGGKAGAGGSAGSAGSAGKAGAGGSAGTGGSGGAGDPTAVCARWKADRANMAEAVWTGGDKATCKAGDVAPPGRETTVRLINLYRWLANLPAVDHEATRDAKAQQCSLMVSINGLNHNPPSSWKCYTADGAEAAGKSNESSGPAVMSIDMYMGDQGNATTFGHRRWLLSNSLGPVGVGSVSSSCLMVIGGSGQGKNAWTAFPSPGYVPSEIMSLISSTAWTIQSDSISLASAVVKITDGAVDMPVTVAQLGAGYGSSYAISLTPKAWKSQVGHTYHVSVTGTSKPIAYDVTVVDCK